MQKSIIIIGAGMGSLASGIFGQLNDYRTQIFLPGLSNFYFVGAWATSTGALFSNANSGKKVIKAICPEDGKKFLEDSQKPFRCIPLNYR